MSASVMAALARSGRGVEGFGIRELDADHQAAAADLGHVRVAGRGRAQAVEQAMAQGLGAGGQPLLLEHVEGRERGRA